MPKGWMSLKDAISKSEHIKDRAELKRFLSKIFAIYFKWNTSNKFNGQGEALLLYLLSLPAKDPRSQLMRQELFQEVGPLRQQYHCNSQTPDEIFYLLAVDLRQFFSYGRERFVKDKIDYNRVALFILSLTKENNCVSRDLVHTLATLAFGGPEWNEAVYLEINIQRADLLKKDPDSVEAPILRSDLKRYLNSRRFDEAMLRERYEEVVLGVVRSKTVKIDDGMPTVFMTAEEFIEKSKHIASSKTREFFSKTFEIYSGSDSGDKERLIFYILGKAASEGGVYKEMSEAGLIPKFSAWTKLHKNEDENEKKQRELWGVESLLRQLNQLKFENEVTEYRSQEMIDSDHRFFEKYIAPHEIEIVKFLLNLLESASEFPRFSWLIKPLMNFGKNPHEVALAASYLVYDWLQRYPLNDPQKLWNLGIDSIDEEDLKSLKSTLEANLEKVNITAAQFSELYRLRGKVLICGQLLAGSSPAPGS